MGLQWVFFCGPTIAYFIFYRLYFASILTFRLLERCFEKMLIEKAFMMVENLDRDKILQKSIKIRRIN